MTPQLATVVKLDITKMAEKAVPHALLILGPGVVPSQIAMIVQSDNSPRKALILVTVLIFYQRN